jgi:hypothetical protein
VVGQTCILRHRLATLSATTSVVNRPT